MARREAPPTPVTQTPRASPDRAPLTEGSVARVLLAFALPTLASSVLQSLSASINAAWIGHLLGQQALAASANANSVLFLLIAGTFGLGLAATVLVAQSLGARDMTTAKKTIGTSLSFFGGVSVVMAGLGFALAPRLLAAMHTPPDVVPLAAAYLRVIFVALPGIVLYSFIMMSLRGAGDAKTPFLFLLLSALVDVVLNPLLIRGVGPLSGLGIAGSALATLFGQWTSLFALLAWLYRRQHPLRLTRSELGYLRVDRAILRALIVKGVPMGLSVVVMSASMLAMISLVNRSGSRVTAAYGACLQLWNYIQMPALALGGAVSSMAAQNVGAKLWDRVARIARVGVAFNVVLTSALIVAVSALNRAAFALFLGNDEAAIEIAQHIHRVVAWSFILFGISFVLSSVVRATGAVLVPLAILVVSLWLVRIPFAYAMRPVLHAEAIWWSFPLGSVVSLSLSVAYYRFGRWREAQMLAPRPPAARAAPSG